MDPHRPLATAILGTGRIGPTHVAAVRQTGLADLVALAGSDPGRTAAMAREWDIPRALPRSQVLEDDTIDIVHIIGTNDVHADLAIRAIEAGKHVVVEKPIALTPADARAIVDAAAAHGVEGMTTFAYWGMPTVQALRSRVREGAVGSVHVVHGSYLQDWLASDTAYDWRCDPVRGGASRALADIGTHWFSLVEFVTGSQVEAVVASLSREHERRADGTAWRSVANEDSAGVLFRLSGGGHGAVVVSQVSHGHGNHLSVEVAGPRGTLAWEAEDPGLVRHAAAANDGAARGAGRWERSGGPEFEAALGSLVNAFYRHVAGLASPDDAVYPTLADGARSVAIVDAALRSVEFGRWYDVEHDRPATAPAGT